MAHPVWKNDSLTYRGFQRESIPSSIPRVVRGNDSPQDTFLSSHCGSFTTAAFFLFVYYLNRRRLPAVRRRPFSPGVSFFPTTLKRRAVKGWTDGWMLGPTVVRRSGHWLQFQVRPGHFCAEFPHFAHVRSEFWT